MGEAEKCIEILLKSKKVSEAAFFARAYAPSKVGEVVKQWEEMLKQRELPF
jgi:coatomer subunit beta'